MDTKEDVKQKEMDERRNNAKAEIIQYLRNNVLSLAKGDVIPMDIQIHEADRTSIEQWVVYNFPCFRFSWSHRYGTAIYIPLCCNPSHLSVV